MKIGLLANSNLWLLPFWEYFSTSHDVWWATYQNHVYEALQSKGISNVVYYPDNQSFDNKLNKYRFSSPGRVEAYLDSQLSPDIWITDVSNRLSIIEKRCLWVQAFHSFCYKKYNFHDSLGKFDMLLLPGDYHYEQYLVRMHNVISTNQLYVTGFPKLDLLSKTPSKDSLIKQLQLNPVKKTILYAPTWGGSTDDGQQWSSLFWPRWSENNQIPYLKAFLERYHQQFNLIIKLHHYCPPSLKAEAKRLSQNYGVLWVDNDPFSLSDPFNYLVVSDLLISDVSGIILEFLYLDKPVIFIEPSFSRVWENSSIPPTMRPGGIVLAINQLFSEIDSAMSCPSQYYEDDRRLFVNSIFKFNDMSSTARAAKAIINCYHKSLL